MDALYQTAPYRSITIQPYARNGNVPGSAIGSPIAATDSSGAGFYTFSLDSLSNGDYFCVALNYGSAYGHFLLRKETTAYQIGLEWWELDLNDTVTDAGGVTVVSPVSVGGQLVGPIIIGDDYLATNDRAFVWTIPAIENITRATATCKFGGKFKDEFWLVEGTITDNEDADYWDISFDLPRASTLGLEPGWYDWSVEIKGASDGPEATKIYGKKRVELRAKQT